MRLLAEKDLHSYQKRAVNFILEKKKCALFLDMGLGKTATTLTAINLLINEGKIAKILIIAPLRVCTDVWSQEHQKWEHLQHLKVSLCTGIPIKRAQALRKDANIYIINKENTVWISELINKEFAFDMLIIDESSTFKASQSARFKALKKKAQHFDYKVLLSGTPCPNDLLDLWSQFYLLDGGIRLYKTFFLYKENCFLTPRPYVYKPKNRDLIYKRINDISLSMSAKEYIELPPKIYIDIKTDLDSVCKSKYYDKIKKEFLLQLNANNTIEVATAAVMVTKLMQICNGTIYDADKNTFLLHKKKISALKELIEENENSNFVVVYHFKSDLQLLLKEFKEAVELSTSTQVLNDWNAGKIKLLLVHPKSAGYGLNAQYGGSIIVWYGLTWSLELYEQMNARLYRQGQKNTVKIIHIIAKKCIDELILESLHKKNKGQKQMLDFIKNNQDRI